MGICGKINVDKFTFTFGIVQALGLAIIITLATWIINYRDGFAWTSNPSLEFNWHPLLMTIGMVFLYANSILVYRAFRNSRKRKLKLAHTFIHVGAFVVTVIGLQAVFDSHNLASPPIPNMYSLHSWIGLTSVILFACQWFSGLITFLYPTLNAPLRGAYLPVHVFFGLCGFVFAIASALLGLLEKAMFALSKEPNLYKDLPSEGLLINFSGILLVIFGCVVVYLVTEPAFKRQPLPEDELLLTTAE